MECRDESSDQSAGSFDREMIRNILFKYAGARPKTDAFLRLRALWSLSKKYRHDLFGA